MTYQVNFRDDAEKDLLSIYRYIATTDSLPKAEKLLLQLKRSSLSLENSPLRGRILPEFQSLGNSHYREIIYKAYRIIYTVQDKNVEIFCVLDGRRELQYLLQQRLLR